MSGPPLAPEHCHGCLNPVNTPGAVADLHCRAVHKAPVGSDSGPDPAVPGDAGTSTELCRWPGDSQDTLTEVCAVIAVLALGMYRLCSASSALGCPGIHPLCRAKGQLRDGAVPWAGQGAEEAARKLCSFSASRGARLRNRAFVYLTLG